MSNFDHSKVHGPVQTLRTELAEWDLANEQWQTPRHGTLTQFRIDGSISVSESQNPNGSVAKSRYIYDEAGGLLEVQFQLDDGPIHKTRHHYDASGRLARTTTHQSDGTERESAIWNYDETGRKTKIQFVEKIDLGACATSFGIEGTVQAYGAEGAAEIRTHYDDREQPSEALFYDANGCSVLSVVFARDAAGRLISEESRYGDKLPFEQAFANMPDEERASASAAFAQLFGPDKAMYSTTYRYDDQGRQIERHRSMFGLGEERTTWQYDEHDNPTREVGEDVHRDMEYDTSGILQPKPDKTLKWETQFDYKYDMKGNWTERVASGRYEGNPEFQRSNIIRRKIAYRSDAIMA